MASKDQTSNVTFDDDDHSTVMMTPATTIADPRELPERPPRIKTSVPCKGKTFIIRETKTGHVLTLFDGRICLLPAETPGSAIHWSCHENCGWLGFKNLASGQYLGYHEKGDLRTMPHFENWEYFCLRMVPEGGYVLLMQADNGNKLWPVELREDQGVQRLAKVDASVDKGLTWEFIEV